MPTRPYQQRRALTTLNQPLEISPALAKIIGNTKGEAIPRKEVIKRLYAYIKEKNLQDPTEKRYFTPDKTMESIFGSERQMMLGMAKCLKDHLTKPVVQ